MITSLSLLRVQDNEGRGPFRPGFSRSWLDAQQHCNFPSIFLELPNAAQRIQKAHKNGLHVGCAVYGGDMLKKWFSATEIDRLFGFGFSVVDASSCRVLGYTATQFLVASQAPLSSLPRYRLEL